MDKKILMIASILGLLSIVLGAFGAHALKKSLSPDQLNSFEVGVKYQMYHALFLLFIAQNQILANKDKNVLLLLIIIGILFFSGSIYLLTTSSITGIKWKFLGPITPLGGMVLIISWIYLFYVIFTKK